MTNRDIKNLFQKDFLIGDGTMGTMLYQHGFFLNTCFDELNLTRPELIETIHREYINAEIKRYDAVVAVGLNCSLGPADMLKGLKRLREVTDKPPRMHIFVPDLIRHLAGHALDPGSSPG